MNPDLTPEEIKEAVARLAIKPAKIDIGLWFKPSTRVVCNVCGKKFWCYFQSKGVCSRGCFKIRQDLNDQEKKR